VSFHLVTEVKRAIGEETKKKKISHELCQNPSRCPLSRSPRRLTRIRVLRLGFRALAAMDGGGAEGELTAQETALYDRQIRVWGVDAQKRCAAAQELNFYYYYYYWPFVPLPLFLIYFNFCSILRFIFQARVG
jgi:hypothetical protein